MKLPVKNTYLLPSFFAYFIDLHRPVKGGGKPDSKVFLREHPLHTSVFNVERCNGEGWLFSSGDNHILAFSTIKLQKVIVRPYTEVVNIHL